MKNASPPSSEYGYWAPKVPARPIRRFTVPRSPVLLHHLNVWTTIARTLLSTPAASLTTCATFLPLIVSDCYYSIPLLWNNRRTAERRPMQLQITNRFEARTPIYSHHVSRIWVYLILYSVRIHCITLGACVPADF
jgi:hypothetical protein